MPDHREPRDAPTGSASGEGAGSWSLEKPTSGSSAFGSPSFEPGRETVAGPSPGGPRPWYEQTGPGDAGDGPPGYGHSGYGHAGYGHSGYGHSGHGTAQPGPYGPPGGYGPPGPYGGYGPPGPYGPPGYAPAPTNTMAILALVFAFVFSPVAIVLGVMARKEIARTGEQGHGLATAGMWLGIAFTALFVLLFLLPFLFLVIGGIAAGASAI